MVTEDDCGTSNGSLMRAIVEGGGKSSDPCATDPGPHHGRGLCTPETRAAGGRRPHADEDTIEELEAVGVDEVKVRTALTCETRASACAPVLWAATWAAAA